MYRSAKVRVYEIMDGEPGGGILGTIFEYFISFLVVLNVLAVVLETEASLFPRYREVFYSIEIASIAVFSIEYLLRVWSCSANPRFRGMILGRIRFILSPMAVIDLLAILPFFIPMVIGYDLRFIRIVRLFRVFKLGRYSDSLKTFGRVFKQKKEELLVVLFIILVLLISVSSIMYFVESDAQPDKFSSIISTMWWAVATLTTVGYGDVFPVTAVGKVLSAVIAILGIGLFALPAGILASGFAEGLKRKKEEKTICPHCGKEITGDEE